MSDFDRDLGEDWLVCVVVSLDIGDPLQRPSRTREAPAAMDAIRPLLGQTRRAQALGLSASSVPFALLFLIRPRRQVGRD